MLKKTLILCFLAILFTIESVSLVAQSSDESRAGFKLNLSYYRDHGDVRPTVIALVVTLTNISKEPIYEDPCSAFGGLYKLVVAVNGSPVEEPERARRHREAMEEGEAHGGICSGSDPGRRIAPGGSWEDTLRWNAADKGTYQFTVERKAFPHGPEDSVTVKSNTVTVIMPDPDAAKPD